MQHTRTTIVVSIAAGLVVLPATVASAATTTLYVNNTVACSNNNSGTSPTAPLCTIAAANSRATAGTTVDVVAGTYKETVSVKNSGTSSARITFQAGSGVTITGGAHGFVAGYKNYVTITGFKVTSTTGVGILASYSSNLVIDHNDVSYAGKPVSGYTAKGISLVHTTASSISNNTTHNNSDAGVGLGNGSTGNQITGNTSYSNARGYVRAAAGIDLRNSGGNTISGNTLYNNEDTGLNVWNSSSNSTAINNYIHNNGDHGIDVHSTNGTHVTGNKVCSNYDSGIEMTGSLNTVISGNISGLNGINSARTSGQLRADSTSAPSTTANNDTLWQTSPLSSKTVFIDWAGTKYPDLPTFRKATGQEVNGTQANGC